MEIAKTTIESIKSLLLSLADASSEGASEREIETEIVFILKELGWERRQIRQDVSISDKDKADVVLHVRPGISILFEAKKRGRTQSEERQVTRYCRMLTPSPKMAFLSDGIRWVAFFVGEQNLIPIYDYRLPDDIDQIANLIYSLYPERLAALHESAFDFLSKSEAACRQMNEDEYRKLLPYLIMTIRHLIFPDNLSLAGNGKALSNNGSQIVATYQPIPAPIPNAIAVPEGSDNEIMTLDCDAPPSLTHTRVQADFQNLTYTEWNNLAGAAIKAAIMAGLSEKDLRAVSGANVRENISLDKKFKPIEDTNWAFQNMDSNRCWLTTIRIARYLSILVTAKIRWLDKSSDQFRGKVGILHFTP